MTEFLDIINKTINGLYNRDNYITNDKFQEAINYINNSSCSLISKTAFAADIIDAFNTIFLLGNYEQNSYEEIDRILKEVDNNKNNVCVDLYVKDLYFNIVDKAYNEGDNLFRFTIDTINTINKFLDYSTGVLLNNDIASISFNSIKKISESEVDLIKNVDELNNQFIENCQKLKK
ncbi:MAG: hypothetical protein MJ068_00200 [Clostridia bacterium]|nr:hypothetical protein [Clostridia bacterium]